MAIVAVRVNTKEYKIACDDGQEAHLQALAQDLDERIGRLNYQMGGNPGEVMALLLSGLMMSDEANENAKETERLSAEVRRLTQMLSQNRPPLDAERMAEMERAMVDTLNQITNRIEKIADQVELR
jgi:cell division protein ZapA